MLRDNRSVYMARVCIYVRCSDCGGLEMIVVKWSGNDCCVVGVVQSDEVME